MTDLNRVWLFSILVFALSALFWALGMIAPIELLPGLPISALGAFCPAFAALILTFWADGIRGAKRLLAGSLDFGRIRDLRWWGVAALTNPLISLIAYLIIQAKNFDPASTPLTFAIAPMFVIFFIAALGEEIGWAGYATTPLVLRRGIFGAGLVIGAIWAVWHFIPLLQVHRSWEWITWWSLTSIALRVIMVWLYAQGGQSVASNALFHTTINLCWQYFPVNGSRYDPQIFALVTLAVAIAFTLLLPRAQTVFTNRAHYHRAKNKK